MVSHSSWCRVFLALLSLEGALFRKPCFSLYLAETVEQPTHPTLLCMATGGWFHSIWALHTHYMRTGALHTALPPVFLLLFRRGMKGWRRSFVRATFLQGVHHCQKAQLLFIELFFKSKSQVCKYIFIRPVVSDYSPPLHMLWKTLASCARLWIVLMVLSCSNFLLL